MKTNSSI